MQHTAFTNVTPLLIQLAKKESAAVAEQLRGTESEVKALRSMTQRIVLTQHEMVGGYYSMKSTNYLPIFSKIYICRKMLFLKGAGWLDIGA